MYKEYLELLDMYKRHIIKPISSIKEISKGDITAYLNYTNTTLLFFYIKEIYANDIILNGLEVKVILGIDRLHVRKTFPDYVITTAHVTSGRMFKLIPDKQFIDLYICVIQKLLEIE